MMHCSDNYIRELVLKLNSNKEIVMKTFYTSLVLLTLVLLNTQLIYPQWVQTNGPIGGNVHCLAVNGNNIFAGTDGGIYRSTDEGANWAPVNSGLTNHYVWSLAATDTTVFAGTSAGVFLSTDNGLNWVIANNGIDGSAIYSLAINGMKTFAGTTSGKIYLSTNNGMLWNPVATGLGFNAVYAIVISDTNIFAGTDGGGVYRSTNNGTNWTQVNNGLNYTGVWSLAICGTNLFAGTITDGVYRSTDNGTSWTKVNNGLYTYTTSLTVSGANIFVGTEYNGVFLSTDNGTNWSQVETGLTSNYVLSLAASGTKIYAGTADQTGGGVFLSTNSGSNWTEVSNGLTASTVTALTISGTSIFAGACGSVSYSTNNGTEWLKVKRGLGKISTIAGDGANIFLGSYGGLYFSTNNGIDWTQNHFSLEVVSLVIKGSKIFAGTWKNYGSGGGVYLSPNYGVTWNISGIPNLTINLLSQMGNNIIASAYSNYSNSKGLFLSTDNGTNWTKIKDNDIANAFAINGEIIFAGTNTGVNVSTNYGTSWIARNTGLTDSTIKSLCADGNNIFAGTNNGIFLSNNSGENWTQVGLSNSKVNSIVISDGYVLAGIDGAGVWKRALSEVLPVELTSFTASAGKGNVVLKWNTATELNNMGFDVERSGNKIDWAKIGFIQGNGNSNSTKNYSFEDKSVSKAGKYYYRLKQVDNNGSYKYSNVAEVELGAPATYALNQSYPNPFNPSTMISYRLKEKGFVKLKVYGIKGDLVKVLVNESKDAGYYESEFDGKGLASGVYIYRLEVIGEGNRNVYSEMKKTVLLK
jgi:hypothetical protein